MKWLWRANTENSRCAAAPMATTRRGIAWRKSRPSAVIWNVSRPTIGSCTGRRRGSTAGYCVRHASSTRSSWHWSISTSPATRKRSSSSATPQRSYAHSSRPSVRRFSTGPHRKWPTALRATRHFPPCAFLTTNFVSASGNSPRRCTRQPVPAPRSWRKRRPVSARPWARCFRNSRRFPASSSTSCSFSLPRHPAAA